ncbi:MAG: FecR domain-containing protein [Rhodanobacteraceae bacterium]
MSAANDFARRQAADWLARMLASDADVRDRDAFERWCAEDDANADAYAAIAADHDFAALLADDPLIADATRKARIEYSGRAQVSGIRRYVALAAAALVVVAVGAGAWRLHRDSAAVQSFATTAGELRKVTLSDGTRVVIDTRTLFDTDFDRNARVLVLHEGRVDIDVARDARPLSVYSGRGVVRDVGTHFEVERHGDDVAVKLLDGALDVSLQDHTGSATLAPGQEARFGARGGIAVADAGGLADGERWTEGTLVFRERRLADLIAEVNRYSTVQLRLADPSLDDLRVSGVFHVGDQKSLLEALRVGWSIAARQASAQEIELSRN